MAFVYRRESTPVRVECDAEWRKDHLVHPGHSFSTSDVYDGLCEGLRLNGVEVVPFEWQRPLRMMATMTGAAVGTGFVSEAKAPQLEQYGTWFASANAVELALDQDVDAVIVVNGILFPPSRARLLQKLQIPVISSARKRRTFSKQSGTSRRFTRIGLRMNGVARGVSQRALPALCLQPATHQPGAKGRRQGG